MKNRTVMVSLQLIGVGWYIVVCLFFGMFGGLWIDRRLSTEPVFTLLGVLIGTILAFYGIYKIVKDITRTN